MKTTSRWWIAGILNANDAAATAKHTDLTAAKILFAQTAKGQDVLTNDNALVEELRINDTEIYLPLLGKAANRIEAQAAEIERLREALNYAWDLIEEASYSDSVMGVKQDRFLSTYYDENGLRAALGETE